MLLLFLIDQFNSIYILISIIHKRLMEILKWTLSFQLGNTKETRSNKSPFKGNKRMEFDRQMRI